MNWAYFIDSEAFLKALHRIGNKKYPKPKRITQLDLCLKFSLWRIVSLAAKSKQKQNAKLIYENICSYPHWHQNIINVPEKLSWLIQPIESFDERIDAMSLIVAERLEEMLASKNEQVVLDAIALWRNLK